MNATDNANDRCARCDCEEQMETLRRERDTAREDARLLGSVLARYTTIPRSRMALLLWRSVRGRQAQRHRNALLRGLEKMRADGLDLDDIATAPHWTGKVLVGGRCVFDLATYEDAEAALEHERNNTMCSEAAAAAISSAAQMMRAALATDAGKEMLERVRRAEAEDRVRRAESGRARNLRAAQSLHRAWRRERDEAKALLAGVLAITPTGRLPFDGWEKELTAARDAAQRALAVCVMQRDEARELVREYAEEHQRASAASALGRSAMCECPLCLKSARILEVKP